MFFKHISLSKISNNGEIHCEVSFLWIYFISFDMLNTRVKEKHSVNALIWEKRTKLTAFEKCLLSLILPREDFERETPGCLPRYFPLFLRLVTWKLHQNTTWTTWKQMFDNSFLPVLFNITSKSILLSLHTPQKLWMSFTM